MFDAAFYDVMMEATGAVFGAMRAVRARSSEQAEPPPPLLQLRAGYAESPGWFLIQATEFDPEPLTVANLRVRDMYGAKRLVQALLDLMASEKWLDRTAQDTYYLDEDGRAVVQRIQRRRLDVLAQLAPLPPGEIGQLAAWLRRLIEASLASATPPGTWCLAHSRRRAPLADAPPLLRIVQYFDDFNAFRDDAHMAAWQPYAISGHAWEAFATVCSGAADSAAGICDRLAHRGYSRTDYAVALLDLTDRGWLESSGDGARYSVTTRGRTVRAQVETLTDRYFYAPWSCLTEQEIAALHDLLIRFRDQLLTY